MKPTAKPIKWKQSEVAVADLVPYERNPRRISDKAFQRLVDKIKRNGYHQRILATKDLRIIGGHQRIKALQSLGIATIEVLTPDRALSEAQFRELLVTDNLQDGEFDFDMLAADFDAQELLDWGMPEAWLQLGDAGGTEGLTDPDDVPAIPKTPTTVLGDIWLLGDHRVMCGDSTSIDAVEKLMDGQKADMVFTDPPYGVSYTGGLQNTAKGLRGNSREMIKNDDVDLYEEAVTMASIFCTGVVFMFYADTVPFGLYRGIEKVGGEVVALIIWKKKGGYGALGASYKPNHEPCVIWKKKGAKLNFIGSTSENRVWEEDKEGVNKLHPTQKPVSIPERAIRNHTAETVLDLFLGSGSTLIACEKTGRTCYGMELSPAYCDVIVKRWQEFTGKEAVHAGTGRQFGES
jgi:DNA modification methylase